MEPDVVPDELEPTHTFDEAIALTGFGKYNFFVLLASGFVTWATASELVSAAILVPSARCDLQLTSHQMGLILSAPFIGIAFTACFSGTLADFYGRRTVITMTLAVNFIVTLINVHVKNFVIFFGLRVLTGILLGSPYVLNIAYIGEFSDTEHREKMIAFLHMFNGIGNAYTPIIAWIIVGKDVTFNLFNFTYTSWRICLFLITIPEVIAIFSLLFLPESPRFLHATGETDKALEILSTMYHVNTGNSKKSYPVTRISKFDKSFTIAQSCKDQIRIFVHHLGRIAKEKFLITTILLLMIAITASIGLGFYMWIPDFVNTILQNYGHNETMVCRIINTEKLGRFVRSSQPDDACNDSINSKMYILSITMTLLLAQAFIIIGLVVNLLGKRTIIVICYITAAVSCFMYQILTSPVLIAIFTVCLFVNVPCTSMCYMYGMETFETQYRGTILATFNLVGQVGVVVGITFIGLLQNINCHFMFSIIGGLNLFCAFVATILPSNVRKKMED